MFHVSQTTVKMHGMHFTNGVDRPADHTLAVEQTPTHALRAPAGPTLTLSLHLCLKSSQLKDCPLFPSQSVLSSPPARSRPLPLSERPPVLHPLYQLLSDLLKWPMLNPVLFSTRANGCLFWVSLSCCSLIQSVRKQSKAKLIWFFFQSGQTLFSY